MGNFFDLVLIYPLLNVLLSVYQVINLVQIPYALGFTIIAMTVIIRLSMYPLMSSQIKSSKKMQDLAPEISKIKEKYKGDNMRINKETMQLYKESGVNPAAGCLPIIIQLPLIMGLYNLLLKVANTSSDSIVGEINKGAYFDFLKLDHVWDTTFFGLPLGGHPSELLSSIGFVALMIPVATGALQFIQSKMMIPSVSKEKKSAKNKDDKKEDFATTFQKQSLFIFPIMIGFISYSFPIALSLYWNTFTIFGIIQQYRVAGLGGLAEWIERIYGKRG